MRPKKNIVGLTNDSAVLSKLSMTSKMYVTDPYLKYFVADKDVSRSRSPLINRFYYLRYKAIEYGLKRLQDVNQVISLDVAINKAKALVDNHLIDNNQRLLNINELSTNCKPFIILRTENYCLIGADLRDYESLCQLFIDEDLLKDVTKESKICLFNECSLCYLLQEISDKVIQMFRQLYQDKCHSLRYLGFEQLMSFMVNHGFSQVMINHFQTIGSPLKTFLNKTQIISRFKNNLKFESIEVIDMKTFFDLYIDIKEKQRINSLEMFDEFEEFDSVCSCYALTIAETLYNNNDINNDQNECIAEQRDQIRSISKPIDCDCLVFRFGHSSCLTKDNQIVIFGGFGCDSNGNNSHKRLSNIIKINTNTDEIHCFKPYDRNNEIQRIHSNIIEIKDNIFFISGGRLSPKSVMDNKIVRLSPHLQTYQLQEVKELDIPKVFRHLVIKDKESDKIIQIGGKSYETNVKYNNYYYVLDTNSMKWQKLFKTNIQTDIYSHSGVSIDPNVFITNGGLNCLTNDFTTNDFNIFDERMSSANVVNINHMNQLYSHKIKLLDNNKLLIIGGINKMGANNRLDLIDLRSHEIVNSFDIITETPLMLTNFSSELIITETFKQLWLIGGGGNCFSFGTHFNKLSVLSLDSFI
ncbi:tRNA wybutosine-synthesizing protein 4-like isoform X2 [Oppia nitens]|uniref:tRNA wybutosine-synthesizing protein 4-like isoform X2 n=1 Tax=Oppia nitens TaxID=1686743 RepID=UPI0023DC3B51|nr:tRNA wybutosine-synthesizing protein 4-like isoform X2 [Oppia nitens]